MRYGRAGSKQDEHSGVQHDTWSMQSCRQGNHHSSQLPTTHVLRHSTGRPARNLHNRPCHAQRWRRCALQTHGNIAATHVPLSNWKTCSPHSQTPTNHSNQGHTAAQHLKAQRTALHSASTSLRTGGSPADHPSAAARTPAALQSLAG